MSVYQQQQQTEQQMLLSIPISNFKFQIEIQFQFEIHVQVCKCASVRPPCSRDKGIVQSRLHHHRKLENQKTRKLVNIPTHPQTLHALTLLTVFLFLSFSFFLSFSIDVSLFLSLSFFLCVDGERKIPRKIRIDKTLVVCGVVFLTNAFMKADIKQQKSMT